VNDYVLASSFLADPLARLIQKVLFHRSSHSRDKKALKEQEDQNYRYNRNQNGGGKLVVLSRKLRAELNEAKGQRPQLVGTQKNLSQDKLVPGGNPIENAEGDDCWQR
jgi:hypothetical protein